MVKELTAIQKGEKEPAKDIKVPLHWAVKNKPGYSYQGDFVKLTETLQGFQSSQPES